MSKENINNISDDVQRSVMHVLLTMYESYRDDGEHEQDNIASFLDHLFGDE